MNGLAALTLGAAVAASGPVVVMPPEGVAGADEGWVARAVTELLPRALQRIGVPAIDRLDRLRAQEALGIPVSSTTRATSVRLAEALGARQLVIGSYGIQGTTLTLAVRLLDVDRATLSAPLGSSGPVEDLLGLVYRLAWDVALAGPYPPPGTRQDLLDAASAVPFAAVRALGEGLAAGDAAGRIRSLRRAVAAHGGFDEARLCLARELVETRQFAEALSVLERIPLRSPFTRPARFIEGVARLLSGRHAEAGSTFESLAAEEASGAVLSNHAIALLRAGAPARAHSLLRRAVEMEPSAPDFAFNLGWVLFKAGQPEAAAFWLRGVLRRDPTDADARLALSWALLWMGQDSEADRERQQLPPRMAAQSIPDPARPLERIQISERALLVDAEGRSDAEMAATHVARGEEMLAAGDAEGALAELTRAALNDPYSARAHVVLARAQRRRGDREKAVAELRMSLWCREDASVRRELVDLLREMGRHEEAARVGEGVGRGPL